MHARRSHFRHSTALPLVAALLACALPSASAGPPPSSPGAFSFPKVLPLSPRPAPPVEPGAVPQLTADLVYAFEWDAPLTVLASPEGLVKVTRKKGPVEVYAAFLGGAGKKEWRQFGRASVFVVEPVTDGRVELLAIPEKVTEAKDVQRMQLDVVMGNGPRPPPGPGPQPVDGRLGLTKASREGLAKVTSGSREAEAKALAKANRALASAVAAGAVVKPAEILTKWREGNNAAVDGDAWTPWGETVSARLSLLWRDGKLPTAAEWAEAFNEIAAGLEGK